MRNHFFFIVQYRCNNERVKELVHTIVATIDDRSLQRIPVSIFQRSRSPPVLYLSFFVANRLWRISLWERVLYRDETREKNRAFLEIAKNTDTKRRESKEKIRRFISVGTMSPFVRKSLSWKLTLFPLVPAMLPLSSNIIYLLPISWPIDSAVSGETWFTTPWIGMGPVVCPCYVDRVAIAKWYTRTRPPPGWD